MIILKATTETLQIVTSSASAVDFSVSYADITTTTFNPSTNEGKISTATTTAGVVAAPAASTQRQVKLITISNRDPSLSNIIIVQKLISSTTYNMTPSVTLLPGETMQYMDGTGWIYYSATGAIKGSQTAAGSNTQIQFNNGGVLAGDADLTWNSSSNTLALGTSPTIVLGAVSATPTLPAAGNLQVYSQVISGRTVLMKQGNGGDYEPLQAAFWENNVALWTAGAAGSPGGNTQGTSATGSASVIATSVTTNNYTAMRKNTFTSGTTASSQFGFYTDNQFFRGAATGMGGFFFVCRFGLSAWTTGSRLFVGLSGYATKTGLVSAQDPSATTTASNSIGFMVGAADTAITFLHTDGSATPVYTKETITGQPTLAANVAYDAYIFARANDTTIYYRLDNANTGVTLVDTSVTANLPTNTVALAGYAVVGNGSSTTASSVTLGVNRLYVESNR